MMDRCTNCKNAVWDCCEGYSSKECGMSGARGYYVVSDCKKECEEFFNDGEGCEEYEECDEDDYDPLLKYEALAVVLFVVGVIITKLWG